MRSRTLLFCACALLAQLCHAQDLSLAQALAAARSNIDVSLARRNLASAQADISSADHAPAPILTAKASSIDLQNGIGGGNLVQGKRIDKSLGLDWTWERGGKRELRTRAARGAAEAAQADLEEALVQQQITTAGAFYDLLAAQQRIAEVEALSKSAGDLAATAARRLRAGDLSQQDVTRTEIESQRSASDLRTAQADARRAALVLAQAAGLAATPVARDAWPATALPPATMESINSRADIRAAELRVRAAEAALDSALALRKNDVTVGGSFDHYPGTSNRLLELRVSVPLAGVMGGYGFEGEIAKAQAQADLARDQLEKVRRAAGADAQRQRQDLEAAAARALGYQDGIVPRARQVAAMAETAYTKGAASLTELIDARRTLRAVLLEDLSARADFARALAAWQLRNQPPRP